MPRQCLSLENSQLLLSLSCRAVCTFSNKSFKGIVRPKLATILDTRNMSQRPSFTRNSHVNTRFLVRTPSVAA